MSEQQKPKWHEVGKNIADLVDSWRIFPRIFISVYIYTYYESIMWFMAIDEPTTQQFGLVSVITGIGAGWFTAYVATRGDGGKPK